MLYSFAIGWLVKFNLSFGHPNAHPIKQGERITMVLVIFLVLAEHYKFKSLLREMSGKRDDKAAMLAALRAA